MSRKIIVLEFITLDGVMQAPGGPEEDPSSEFNYGGWTAPFFREADKAADDFMAKAMKPADLLLGRKTFDIWENYWPSHADLWPGVNEVTKYVLSTKKNKSDWQNSVFLHDLRDIEKLKNTDGSDLKIWGSSEIVQLLLKNNLVDEFFLMTYPIVLGKGKKLFDNNAIPASFKLADSMITSNGVIMANYRKAGEVKTGTVGA